MPVLVRCDGNHKSGLAQPLSTVRITPRQAVQAA